MYFICCVLSTQEEWMKAGRPWGLTGEAVAEHSLRIEEGDPTSPGCGEGEALGATGRDQVSDLGQEPLVCAVEKEWNQLPVRVSKGKILDTSLWNRHGRRITRLPVCRR